MAAEQGQSPAGPSAYEVDVVRISHSLPQRTLALRGLPALCGANARVGPSAPSGLALCTDLLGAKAVGTPPLKGPLPLRLWHTLVGEEEGHALAGQCAVPISPVCCPPGSCGQRSQETRRPGVGWSQLLSPSHEPRARAAGGLHPLYSGRQAQSEGLDDVQCPCFPLLFFCFWRHK